MTEVHGLGGIMRAGGGTYGRRHPRGVATIRIATGLWLTALTATLCSRGWYWGLALLPFAALHLWLAARLLINDRAHH